jgi:hypothetical protein
LVVIYYGGVGHQWSDIRLVGILQRIAICYLFASVLFLNFESRCLVAALLALLVGYWALMTFVPVPGVGVGSFKPDANLANWLDLHYLPGRLWDETRDPEGLLSTLPAIGTCVLGVLSGLLLKDERLTPTQKSLWLITAGVAMIAGGYLWSLQFPIIKAIWTSSFVLVAGGYSAILLAVMYQVIDVWGSDHHGYITRTKAAMQALGYDPSRLDILVYQFVRLFSGGELVRMSKRAGDLIPLSEVVEQVGKDASRFFFLMRSADTLLDFDLDLAKQQSAENPVYHVQYGHARICSILRQAAEVGVKIPKASDVDLTLLKEDAELELLRKITEFPDEVEAAALGYAPHRLTTHSMELATLFHKFYTVCRVLGEAPPITAARLVLSNAARAVLKNVLTLMGINAPERM